MRLSSLPVLCLADSHFKLRLLTEIGHGNCRFTVEHGGDVARSRMWSS